MHLKYIEREREGERAGRLWQNKTLIISAWAFFVSIRNIPRGLCGKKKVEFLFISLCIGGENSSVIMFPNLLRQQVIIIRTSIFEFSVTVFIKIKGTGIDSIWENTDAIGTLSLLFSPWRWYLSMLNLVLDMGWMSIWHLFYLICNKTLLIMKLHTEPKPLDMRSRPI